MFTPRYFPPTYFPETYFPAGVAPPGGGSPGTYWPRTYFAAAYFAVSYFGPGEVVVTPTNPGPEMEAEGTPATGLCDGGTAVTSVIQVGV